QWQQAGACVPLPSPHFPCPPYADSGISLPFTMEPQVCAWGHSTGQWQQAGACVPLPSPHFPRPPYADSGVAPPFTMEPQVHGEEGQRRMREAGQLAARVRDHAGTLVKPGVTTDEIDRAVHEMIIEAGAYPSPLSMPTPCAALPPSSPLLPPSLQPGVTTDEIDCAVHEMVIEEGAYPSPHSVCTFRPCCPISSARRDNRRDRPSGA
ncbi:unnamed protein product, partial [Closterium sp. NIES-54]